MKRNFMAIKKYKLNKEELEIKKAFENGEFKSVKNLEKELKRYQAIANAHVNTDKRANFDDR